MRLNLKKIKTKLISNKLLLSFITSALLCSLAFVHKNLYWLIFVSLVPLFLNLKDLKEYKLRSILKGTFFGGFIFSLIVLIPILQPAESTWSQTQGSAVTYIKIIAWTISSAVFAICFLIAGYFGYKNRKEFSKFIWLLVLLWPICEIIRAYIFALYSFGPGGSLSPNLNLGTFGLAVSASPLAYLSRFIGLFGLSAIAILINIVLLNVYRKNWKIVLTILTPILILNSLAYFLYQPSAKIIKVAAVHLNEKETLEEWRNTDYPTKDTDLLVLPEYSLFLKGNLNHKTKHLGDKTIVITSIETGETPHKNTLTYYNKKQKIINQQDKTFLIPSGEFIPYVVEWTLKLLKMDSIVSNFNSTLQVKKGGSSEQVKEIGNYKYGALACSGVVNLNQYANLTKDGAEILVNTASLSFLEDKSTYRVQEYYFAKFHAISNARPFIQSSRSGQSFIMDSNGHILDYNTGDSGLISHETSLVKPRTIYSILR